MVTVVRGLEELEAPRGRCVLSIGNFDGVHRAHQQLIAQAGLFAANTGDPVTVLTFDPHPLTVVAPDRAPPRLTSPEDKVRFLAEAGADVVVVARSDPKLLELEAEAFIAQVIRDRFHPTHIVEGPSFGFGRQRKGTPDLLVRSAADFDCEVHIVQPVTVEIDQGEKLLVSSSLIRRLVRGGQVHRAALCLGRPYFLRGRVEHGDQRGRDLEFPTINLSGIQELVPGDGVYAGRAEIGRATFTAAISVGGAPTFGSNETRIEAHVLDFDADVYGEPVTLFFDHWLRGQQRFDSVGALVEQIKRDVELVRTRYAPPSVSDQRRQRPC